MKKCRVCDKNIEIRLHPNYSSSGLWCNCCGAEFSNPAKDFVELSFGLLVTIEGWVFLWEMAQRDNNLNREYFENKFIKMGKYLQREISKYYHCVFDENIRVFTGDDRRK